MFRAAPGAAGHGHAETPVDQAVNVVRVGVDDQGNAQLAGAGGVGILEVQPFRGGVDFHRRAGGAGGLQQGFNIKIHRLPPSQQAG